MKYVMELTAVEVQALDETLRIVRKGGDARLVAKSKAGISLACKAQALCSPDHDGHPHFLLWPPPPPDVRRVTTLLPPPPSTNVVASTTLADSE